jgi:hypothetical protein
MLAFSIWNALWVVFVTYLFITVLMKRFSVIADIFRDKSLNGGAKAAWLLFLALFEPSVQQQLDAMETFTRTSRRSPVAARRASSRRLLRCTAPAGSMMLSTQHPSPRSRADRPHLGQPTLDVMLRSSCSCRCHERPVPGA